MASAWGKPGAWAQDVEETETALQSKPKEADPEGDFPSLAAAMAAKPKKSKNKGAKLSLAEFTTGIYVGPGAKSRQAESKGLTPNEMLMLPTGPRERTAEELERERGGGLGGGFRGYGGDRDRDRDRDTRERRRDSGFDPDEPSRADSSSHWGSSKLSNSSSFGRGDRDRDRDRDRDKDGPSRADGADDWGAAKKFTPSSDRKFGDAFGGGGGGGFADSGNSRADESSNWAAQKQQTGGRGFDSYSTRRGGGGRSGFDFFSKDGGGGGPEGDNWSRRDDNGDGGAGRPRLVLQPRTAPLEGAPKSSSSSLGEAGAKPRSSNPFGEAKPREQVLEEKGMDWKKIDMDLETRGKRDAVNADVGARINNSQADDGPDRTERDWRKTNTYTNGKRSEETPRAASGDDSSHTEFKHLETVSNHSDESDDSGLVKNEKAEQLGNDLSQKAHVSQKNNIGDDSNSIGRW